MMYRIRNWLVATLLLLCAQVGAATLSDIQVSNGNQQARITLSFIGDPDYAFSHQSKRTVALDIKQTGVIQGLPLLFSGNNLVKAIRSGTPKDAQTLRLVVDLTENGKTEAVKRQNGSNYTVVFTINADAPPPPPPPPVVAKRVETPAVVAPRVSEPARNPFKTESNRTTGVISSNTVTRPAARATANTGDKIIIAIDAGHGGQDPGAIGPGGTREKNVTIAIARKLRTLLNNDPMFKGVLTPQELVLRIAAVLRRCYAAENPLLELAASRVNFATAEVERADGQTVPLTAKEHEILSVLARNAGRIVTIDALCEACWGTSFGYENSLMAHIRRLREKIEANPSKPASLVTARGLGYKLVKRG